MAPADRDHVEGCERPRSDNPVRDRIDGSIIVLESFRPNPSTNPYLLLLLEAVRARVRVETFSWRRALLGRYHVLHVHWPEVLMRGRTRTRTIARSLAFLVVLVVLRVRRRALVRTLHNVQPHEALDRLGRGLLALCDRWTTEWIVLTAATPPRRERGGRTIIPLGHYQDWYPDAPAIEPEVGRVLFFGLIRRYKGIEELLEAAQHVRASEFSLRIIGRVVEPGLAATIQQAERTDARISAQLEYVDDHQLASEIGTAELVVLPFRRMTNSSSALLALSLARPILVPASPTMCELADEVGHRWVITYEGELTADVLIAALGEVSGDRPPGEPDLSRREWDQIGEAHVGVFLRAAGSRHR